MPNVVLVRFYLCDDLPPPIEMFGWTEIKSALLMDGGWVMK